MLGLHVFLSDLKLAILLLLTLRKLHVTFRLAYLHLTLTYSKDQLGRWNGVSPNILTFLSTLLHLVDIHFGHISDGVKGVPSKKEGRHSFSFLTVLKVPNPKGKSTLSHRVETTES